MNLPFKYYFYGSDDSTDSDVLIEISKELMPVIQEDRKIFLKEIEKKYDLKWNANLIVIENGIVSDTIYPKSWIDSVNNSLYYTYRLHLNKQKYELPVFNKVERNKHLAIYKCIRTVLSMLSRSHYRTKIKPILNGIHDFKFKIEALRNVDFTTLNTFEQRNVSNVDIWKIIAFYVGQNISLIKDNIEIYTKKDLVKYYPELTPFIYRHDIKIENKEYLNRLINYYVSDIIVPFDRYHCENGFMKTENYVIDMKKEIWL